MSALEASISNAISTSQPTSRTEREASVQRCVRQILGSEGVPPFREHANQVMSGTLDPGGTSSRLARVVLKDLGLSSQILRLGNSAAYNRSERSVIDVAHAITLMGWENVRSLVSALKYIEHFAAQSPGFPELMAGSLLSGFHVREVAVALQYPWPEDAYVAGLFRGLGEVLIARHYPKEYAEILLAVVDEKIPWPAACVRVLGFSWDEIGVRIAESWRLPSKVILCLGGGEANRSVLDRCLISIADYGHALTNSLYREGAPMHTVQLCPVLTPQGQPTILSVRDLGRIVESSLADTQATLALLRIPPATLLLSEHADKARQLLDSAPALDSAALRPLESALQEASRSLGSSDFELSSFVSSLLDQLRAVCFDRVVFGLVNDERTLIRGRLGSGDHIDSLLDRFEFAMNAGDGALLALQHKVDLLVDRTLDDRYEESPFIQALDPKAFLLLPLVIHGESVGCLYADCQRRIPDLHNGLGLFGRVRDVIAQAIRKKAAGPKA
jgi:HD-like signal output (HDOD) protein